MIRPLHLAKQVLQLKRDNKALSVKIEKLNEDYAALVARATGDSQAAERRMDLVVMAEAELEKARKLEAIEGTKRVAVIADMDREIQRLRRELGEALEKATPDTRPKSEDIDWKKVAPEGGSDG